ncbi:MAG: 3-oxoacyl-[acyl-carrier-protein] reductase [Anaerolineae bacterium]|jgi:3-oxoacyl-[acyl-carrier protein] reductase|nr:3-oxoacyl-[acyl-carrier-protein] reductase [Anaerolineae bacterium]
MTSLTGRVAVITGASRGIGKGIALEFAKRGAKVVVNYHSNAESANAVVDEITANGGSASAFQADVSIEEQANELIKYTTTHYEQIDILVNNAGVTRDNVIMLMKPEDFDTVINTNLRSAWLCSKAAVRSMMRKRYGRIINITSISGIMGQAGQTNYSASKAGIIGFTKSLAREIASRNITVNAVAPGFVLTDLTKDLSEELVNQSKTFIPLARWGEVAEIAYAAAFLASDEAGYITGHVLNVDGGTAM